MMETEITIREMKEDDYDSLVTLWKAAGLSFKPEGRDSRERIHRELQGASSIYMAAFGGEKMVGAVLGTHDGRKGWINRLAVHPAWQRRCLATRLLEEVERRMEENDIHIVAALVEDWNEPSLTLFEHAGFTRHDDITYFTRRKDASI